MEVHRNDLNVVEPQTAEFGEIYQVAFGDDTL